MKGGLHLLIYASLGGPQTIDYTPPAATAAANVPASAAGTGSASAGYLAADAPSVSQTLDAAGTGDQLATYDIPIAVAVASELSTNALFDVAEATATSNAQTGAPTGSATHQVTTAEAIATANQPGFLSLLVDNGIYGGFGYTGTDTLATATLTVQSHGVEYTDPFCGGAITRVAAGNYAFGGPTTTRLHPEYSELQAFTYSQKFVMLRGSGGGVTGSNDHGVQVIRLSDLSHQHSMSFSGHGYQVSTHIRCMYHPNYTDSFHAFTRVSSGAVSPSNPWRLTRYDLNLDGSDNVTSSGTEDMIVFNGGTGAREGTYYTTFISLDNSKPSWEDCSWDGQFVALSAQKADTTWEIVVVDIINGVIDQVIDIPSLYCDPNQYLEWVQMSPSGDYVLVAFAPPATLPSWGQYSGIKCYNRSNGLYRCSISDNVGHSDCTWDRTTGIEWLVQDGASSSYAGDGYGVGTGHDIVAIDIAQGVAWTTEFVAADITTSESQDRVRRLLNMDTTAVIGWHSIHVSCTNYLYNRAQYAVISAYGSDGETTEAFHDEIFKVYLTSTKATPVVKRLQQHRSDTGHVDYTGGSDYYSQPHATVSPDGRWIVLGSNFDVRTPIQQIDAYLIKDGWHRDLTPMTLNKFPLRVRAYAEGGHIVANHNGWPAGGWDPVYRRFTIMAYSCDDTGWADYGGGSKLYGNDEALFDLETNRVMNLVETEGYPDPYVEKSPGSSRFAWRHYDHGGGGHTYRATDGLVYYFGSGSVSSIHADLRGFDASSLTAGASSTEEYYAAFYSGNEEFGAGDPLIKQATAMVYNPDDDCLYCFGGKGVEDDLTAYGGSDQIKAKLWKYSFSTGLWSDPAVSGMPTLYSASAAWDTLRSKIWVFGSTFSATSGSKNLYLYDPVAGTITLQSVTGHSSMTGRGWSGFCYDAENDALVLFGGANEDWPAGLFGASYTDVWVLDCETLVWSEISVYPSGFTDAYEFSQHLGYSPTEKCVYMMCHLNGVSGTGAPENAAGGEVWALRLSSPSSILEAFNANTTAVANPTTATGTSSATITYTPAEATATANDSSAAGDIDYTPPTATAAANDQSAAAGTTSQIIGFSVAEAFAGSNAQTAAGTGTATATYTPGEGTGTALSNVGFLSGTFVSDIEDVWTIPGGGGKWTIPDNT